jgi:hypothetical protein
LWPIFGSCPVAIAGTSRSLCRLASGYKNFK